MRLAEHPSSRERLGSRDLDEAKFFDSCVEAEGLLTAESLAFDPEEYLQEETYRVHTIEKLGSIRGERGLDCGCGPGEGTVVLASRGAEVFSFDVSQNQLRVAKKRAKDNRVNLAAHFLRASAGRLPFPDNSLDFAFGGGVLHHFDLPQFAPELRRVLRPGARVAFWEPLGENPLLEFARDHLPYPKKCGHSPHEKPLRYADINLLRKYFSRIDAREFELTAMIYRVIHNRPLFSFFEKIDEYLLRRFPRLRPYCRYVVISMER